MPVDAADTDAALPLWTKALQAMVRSSGKPGATARAPRVALFPRGFACLRTACSASVDAEAATASAARSFGSADLSATARFFGGARRRDDIGRGDGRQGLGRAGRGMLVSLSFSRRAQNLNS